MASYTPGYDEERFASAVNRNFLCLICFNVLKDPVRCSRNQHIFCRGCITKHLESSHRCPTCADPLTEQTLTGAPPIVKDYLNELNIHCLYVNRGCQETVQLQHLDRHEATCGFQPVVCTNQGCGVTVSRRDRIHHESEVCELRKSKCHSCGEISKTLEVLEKRIGKRETNVETKIGNLEKNMDKNIADMKTDMEGKFEAVNNEVRGLKAALVEGFDQMKEVLVKIEDIKEEIRGKVRFGASGDEEKENIIVVGGSTKSVEMFNWRRKLWSPLQSLPEQRYSTTSFVYNNHVTTAGGWSGFHLVDNMLRMNIDPAPDLSANWSESPIKLPGKLECHSSVLYNDKLFVIGGNPGRTSDSIQEVQLVPPYAAKTLSRMPEPRQDHCAEIFDDHIVIVGGSTTRWSENNLKSVVLYDIAKNECKQLASLPYEVSHMATVKWSDNIVVIGGTDKHCDYLDTVIIYNVKTEQSHMLPPMRCKRAYLTAVVVGNNIVVLGGTNGQGDLKSVEAFNFDTYTWKELPEMSEERAWHTAVVV